MSGRPGWGGVFGRPRDKIPGEGMCAKFAAMSDLSATDFLQRVKDHGFVIKMEPQQACMIPGEAFMLVVVNPFPDAAHGVCMLMPGSKKTAASAKLYYEQCLAAFPSACAGTHEAISKFVTRLADAD